MLVLVADDDPVYRDLMNTLLGQWGFEVTVAADGNQAWEILQRPDAPNLVILDWMMPGMDGFEVCRRIREAKDADSTYVLIMTGGCNREELIKVVVVGADDYMIKPFEPLDLKVRLRTATRILNMQDELRRFREESAGKARRDTVGSGLPAIKSA
jgi:DNA-binding response OmpR family regulator